MLRVWLDLSNFAAALFKARECNSTILEIQNTPQTVGLVIMILDGFC